MDRLLDVLDRGRLAYEVVFASTVQEEIGLVGSDSLVQDLDCDMAISLDLGLVGDVPGVDPRGAMIVHKDLSNYSRPLTLSLIAAARDAGIPVQPAVFGLYGSDSSAEARLANRLDSIGTRGVRVWLPARTHGHGAPAVLRGLSHAIGAFTSFN
jgi:putative aminopeptidase FrvX